MSSDSFMILFDVIVVCYGVYLIYSAFQMRKTHQPSNLIVNQGDLVGARDVKGFCDAMFNPLVGFGIAAILYGGLASADDRYLHVPMINTVAMPIFLALCIWFVWKMKKIKEKYLR